jgi:hypothetical protein
VFICATPSRAVPGSLQSVQSTFSTSKNPRVQGYKNYKPEVSVAIPIKKGDIEFVCKLLAFLPTEMKPGFGFLINADFVLPASRERLNLTGIWNAALMSSAAKLFSMTFERQLKKMIAHSSLDWKDFYETIPLRSTLWFDSCGTVEFERQLKLSLLTKEIVVATDARIYPVQSCHWLDQSSRMLLFSGQGSGDIHHPFHFPHPAIRSEEQLFVGHLKMNTFSPYDWKTLLSNRHWLESNDDEWFLPLLSKIRTIFPSSEASFIQRLIPLAGTPRFQLAGSTKVYLAAESDVSPYWFSLVRLVSPKLSGGIQVDHYLKRWLQDDTKAIKGALSNLECAYLLSEQLSNGTDSGDPSLLLQKGRFVLQTLFRQQNKVIDKSRLKPFPLISKTGLQLNWSQVVHPLRIKRILPLLGGGSHNLQIPSEDYCSMEHGDEFYDWIFSNVFGHHGVPSVPTTPLPWMKQGVATFMYLISFISRFFSHPFFRVLWKGDSSAPELC